MVSGRLRTVLRKLHLYIGLVFGLLFIMLGLTGTAISWRDELDRWLNPDLLQAVSATRIPVGAATVETVTARLLADPKYGKPNLLMLPVDEHDVFIAYYPIHGEQAAVGRSRQVMIDPITLAVKGERLWGVPGLSRPQLLPTMFHLHRYLLSGDTGKTIIGVTGMMLLLSVLLGIALWWPKATQRAWKQAVRITHGGSWSRFNYSFHRAAGIFVAPVLAITAFSGWYLNLPKWVTPIIASVATVSPQVKHQSETPPPGTRAITPAQAMTAAQQQFPDALVTRVGLPRKPGDAYEVRLRQNAEIQGGSGATRLWLDAYTGRPLGVRDPLNGASGDTLISWLFPLHTGEAFGSYGRAFITVFGLMPLAFAVTGVLIWWKRRSGHRRHLERERGRIVPLSRGRERG
ncbi:MULTISPECIES: PepSY domain-containing protein [unclassified Cupriavidus]|uniref:PepSY-associated TM helix domain-containing protein n=1 Tax=unclassified Cupriavidus TaxID=2640874 RepID=UPI0010F57080|nr:MULTISPECIES: PepSY-associated TM helix domain-containing protein [unclassified Cupriavidus]MWL88246.1 PepSY domain-containing protein [Cupriavidus sp. SW-Y-13]